MKPQENPETGLFDEQTRSEINAYFYPDAVDNQYVLSVQDHETLATAGLTVQTHVPQTGFKDQDHFLDRRNNFNLYFVPRGIGPIMRDANKVYQRFYAIHPELADTLLGYYQAAYDLEEQGLADPFNRTVLQDHIAEFFTAYKIMTELVDANDDYVVRKGDDGQPYLDSWFLCR